MRLITTTAMTISTEKTICRIKQQKKTSMDYVGVNLNGFIRYLTGAHDCHEEKKIGPMNAYPCPCIMVTCMVVIVRR